MQGCVGLWVGTNISEEIAAFFFRVEKYALLLEEGTDI
jgi:hypothetical protein